MDGMSSVSEYSVALFSKNLDFQASMANKLVEGGVEASNEVRSEAMQAQGKGINVNTVA